MNIVKDYGAGLITKTNSTDLYNCLIKLKNLNIIDMGYQARKLIEKEYDNLNCSSRLLKIYKDIYCGIRSSPDWINEKNKYTLGINFLHSDSSACLFKDDLLIAAVEEERFLRSKHTSFFPVNSIKFCLNEAKIVISDIDYITINSNPYSSILKNVLCIK